MHAHSDTHTFFVRSIIFNTYRMTWRGPDSTFKLKVLRELAWLVVALIVATLLYLIVAALIGGASRAWGESEDVLYVVDATPDPDKLYTVDRTDASTTLVGSLGTGSWLGLAWDGSDLYATNTSDDKLYTVDTGDASTSEVGSLGTGTWRSLAWDGSDLYAVETTADSLYRVDRTDGSTTRVGGDGALGTGEWASLAWDGSDLYAVEDINDKLYKIDRTDGSTTLVGTLGSGTWKALAWDGLNLYALDSTPDKLYTVDRTDASTSEVGSLGTGSWFGATFDWHTVPTASEIPTLTSGVRQLDVSWAVGNGGAAITDYDLQYRQTGGSFWTSWAHTGTATTTTITGLTNGTGYDVQVRAENSVGESPWSPTATGTPAPPVVPDAPGLPSVTPADEALAVSWTAPSDGGAAITDYDLQYRQTGGSSWTSWAHTGTALSTTITSLTNGTGYDVQVRAENSAGESPWSTTATGTPAEQPVVPDAPGLPSVTPADEALAVSWTAPSDGGAAITDYDLQYRQTGGSSWTSWAHTGTALSTTITSLTNGTGYDVQVRAENSAGESPWSTTATGTPVAPTEPGTPDAPRLDAVDEEIFVAWEPPDDDGGAAITDYDVRYRETGTTTWSTWLHVGTATFTTITGLTNGTEYDVQVRAENSAGESAWSTTTAGTPAAPPDPVGEEELYTNLWPEAFTVAVVETEDGGAQIVMTWDPMELASGYLIESRDNGVFRRQARVTAQNFRSMDNVVALNRSPGSLVGNTSRGLSHVIVRVRAYRDLGSIERYSPWTEERVVTFPRYDYPAPTGIPSTPTNRDVLGVGQLMTTIMAPAGFEGTSGRDYIIPLLFTAALVLAGAAAWAVSGGGWGASGLMVGALVFILVWGVSGPLWFDVPIAMALVPVVIVSLGGVFAAKKMVEG